MPDDPVTLSTLARTAALSQDAALVGGDAELVDLTHQSTDAGPGVGFIAIPGSSADGHDFAPAAAAAGAPALVVEHPVDADVPQLVVERTRPLMGPLAAAVHHHPAARMTMIGVTGTNGKTTVTHMVESVLSAAGRVPALVGTVGARIAGEHVALRHTTPEATELQRLLHHMVDRGVDTVAMEVSSHALVLGRVDPIRFDVAAFTNLSQDHLDFHGDMDTYFSAKRELFTAGRAAEAVVCIDDPWGHALATSAEIPMVTVSAADSGADIHATGLEAEPGGSRFTMVVAGTAVPVSLPLGGRFNVANALVAAACCLDAGVDPVTITTGLARLDRVPGRFDVVPADAPFSVVVDYAHTPDAMRTVIAAARAAAAGRIVALGGAGGDRDPTKRPAMGAALATADVAVLTTDNPRSEDPLAILEAVASGVPAGAAHLVEPDRRRAIRRALEAAGPGDVVLLLGKGHESGQQVGEVVLPFDDRSVAGEELAALGYDREGGAP